MVSRPAHVRSLKLIKIYRRLAFYFPMAALINLFLYVLKHPSNASAKADVALLDMVVGHFGYLGVLTDNELSYPFVRDVAAIAHAVVEAKARQTEVPTRTDTPSGSATVTEVAGNDLSDEVSELVFIQQAS
jgi:hypothetical protein